MKIKTMLAAAGLSLALSANSFAAGVGIVDIQKLIHASPYSLRLQKTLASQFATKKTKLDALKNKMVAEFENFSKNKAVMKAKDKDAMQKKMEAQRETYFKDMTAFRTDYMAAEKKMSEDFLSKVKSVIKQAAIKNKLDMVLPSDAVFYSVKEVDLTADVMKKLK